MSNKNNRRPARPANRSALKGDLARKARREEARADRNVERFLKVFGTVAPVVERLALAANEFAKSEAGLLSAARADALLRDASSSELGQRALTAVVTYCERGLNCVANEGEARSRAGIARIEAELEPKPAPEVEAKVEDEVEPKPEPKPALKGDLARKLEEAQANLLSARQSLIDEMRMHEAKARELRKELERDNKRY